MTIEWFLKLLVNAKDLLMIYNLEYI